MKRFLLFLISLAALGICACGDTSTADSLIAAQNSSSNTAKESSTAQMDSEAEDTQTSSQTTAQTSEQAEAEEIDLTILDSNMVYAQVFDMVNEPENYLGKKVKVKGNFAHTEDGGKDYFAVFIADAAACCQQGMEFELAGEHVYPDDYPELNSQITVTGTFNTYEEDGYKYCQLKNAQMTTE